MGDGELSDCQSMQSKDDLLYRQSDGVGEEGQHRVRNFLCARCQADRRKIMDIKQAVGNRAGDGGNLDTLHVKYLAMGEKARYLV